MGQRTQVLLQVIDKDNKQKNRVYHFQWGFGRVMPLHLIDLFITDYFTDTKDEKYSIFNNHKLKENALDITKRLPKKLLASIDIDNMEQINNVFDYCDNNNGAMVIQVREKHDDDNQFTIGFLLTTNFSTYVSPKEYMEKNGGSQYSDSGFAELFESFIKYFKIDVK